MSVCLLMREGVQMMMCFAQDTQESVYYMSQNVYYTHATFYRIRYCSRYSSTSSRRFRESDGSARDGSLGSGHDFRARLAQTSFRHHLFVLLFLFLFLR